MSGMESLIQNLVQWMLEACETLGRVVVLVVDMNISVIYRLPDIFGQQAFVNVSLCGLGCELHHHAGRCVGIHISIFTRNIIGLSVNDFLEDFAGLGLAGEISLIPVCDIFLCDFLARTLHELELHAVLDGLDTHFLIVPFGNDISDFSCENDIFSSLGDVHRFQYGGDDFLIVERYASSIAFYYILDHSVNDIRFLCGCTAHCGLFSLSFSGENHRNHGVIRTNIR